jgi:hypothetical protein
MTERAVAARGNSNGSAEQAGWPIRGVGSCNGGAFWLRDLLPLAPRTESYDTRIA